MKRIVKSTLSVAVWLLVSTFICGSAAMFTSCGKNTLEDILGAIDNPSGSTTVAVTSITLDETSLTKIVGDDAFSLTATVNGDATDKTIVWKSDKPSVANVDAHGVVTIQGRGLATITVTATNGTEDTADDKTATCEVAVYNLVNLATLNDNYQAQDFDMLTGTLGTNVKITITAEATVVLKDASINADGGWTSGDYAGITCLGDATIILEGDNKVKGFNRYYPGILPAHNSSGDEFTLTIKGEGKLDASSNGDGYGAGIGAGGYEGANIHCGNIVIESGIIKATANGAAGIGAGSGECNCSDITIVGGDITATGGSGSAGIGAAYSGKCGTITISGGEVTATAKYNAAGIGGGTGINNDYTLGSCGDITISGGTINAMGTGTGDSGATTSGGAGIGAGCYSSCGNITINGGDVTAKSDKGGGAGIGGGFGKSENGNYGSCGTITITATVSKVTATKYNNTPFCIGNGWHSNCGTVKIGSATGTANPNQADNKTFVYEP